MSTNTTQINLSREAIESAIRASTRWGGSPIHPAEGDLRDIFAGYEDPSFEDDVVGVWDALAEGPLNESHHMYLNFTWEPDRTTSGAQVEVTLPLSNGVVAAGWHEIKHLTADRAAKGIDGLLAVANQLIAYANESLTLAAPLVEAERTILSRARMVRA